jgi:predicted DNA-binding WGR domain protein
MRRFEFQEGTSHKFWEVSVEGEQLSVRFGKIGTQGQTKPKVFDSEDEARREAEKLIAEKLRKGYVEVAAHDAPAASPNPKPAPRPKAAQTATRVRLRDASGGELVLMLTGKRVISGEGEGRNVQTAPTPEAAKDHFERLLFLHGKKGLLPVETTQLSAEQAEAELESVIDDFIGTIKFEGERCTITFEDEEKVPLSACTGLVRQLARKAPRSVQLLCDFASPKQAWTRALQGVVLPSITAFIFDTHFQTQTRQGRNSIGDLAAVLAACPHLERLFATGDLQLSPTRHESLRELYLLGDPLSPGLLEGLGGCEFPQLERLGISLASDAHPPDARLLLQALGSLRAPLRELHLESVDGIEEVLDGLASRGLPPSLKVLTLQGSYGDDDDPDAAIPVLQRHASALSALDELGLTSDPAVEGLPVRLEFILEYRQQFLPAGYSEW